MGVQGQFKFFKYESSKGTFIYPIKLQQETVDTTLGGAANAEPAGGVTEFLPSARVSGSRNAIGIHPRTATVKVTATGVTAANALGSTIRIPILSKATAWKKGDTGVYQGDTVQVVRITEQQII